MLICELQVKGVTYFVQNDLLSGLSAKQPKTVSGCVFALKEITRYVCFATLATSC